MGGQSRAPGAPNLPGAAIQMPGGGGMIAGRRPMTTYRPPVGVDKYTPMPRSAETMPQALPGQMQAQVMPQQSGVSVQQKLAQQQAVRQQMQNQAAQASAMRSM